MLTGISAAAAQYLVTQTKIVGVGVDTASIDSGSSENFDGHRILSYSNMYVLENVKLLENIRGKFLQQNCQKSKYCTVALV